MKVTLIAQNIYQTNLKVNMVGIGVLFLKHMAMGIHILPIIIKVTLISQWVNFKSNNSDKTIYLIDKGDYNKVEIFTNKMNDDQKNYAIEITRESINMHKSHFECVKYVKDQFDNKYGGNWCVVFNPRGYGDSCFTYYSCYISFTIGEFDVNIGKTHD